MSNLSARVRATAVLTLRIAVALFLIYIVARSWQQLVAQSQAFDWQFIALSILLYPVSFVLVLIVWMQIVHLHIGSADWRRECAIYCYSNLARSLPLGLVWRIGGRVMGYDKESISRSAIITASLWEIILHAAAAVALLLIVLAIRPIAIGVWFWVLALVLVLIAVNVVFRRIRQQSLDLANGDLRGTLSRLMHLVRTRDKVLALILTLNAITWLNAGLMLQLLVYALNPHTAFDYLDALQAWLVSGLFGYVALFLPFLDIGAKEAAMTVVLSAHMTPAMGLVVAILYRLIFTVSDIFCSSLGLVVTRRVGQSRETETFCEPEQTQCSKS